MKPNLLVFTSTFPRWPNDTDPPFVYELAKRLTDEFNVYVLAPHYTGAKTHEHMDGVSVYRFRYFFEKYERLAGATGILPTLKTNKFYFILVPFFLVIGFLNLLKLLYKLRPDVVHSHWLIPQGFLTALAAKIFRTPFIVTVHGADLFALNNGYLRWLKVFTVNCADKITIVSTAMLNQAQREFPSRDNFVLIPMGVDSNLFKRPQRKTDQLNIYPQALRVLFVGRITEKKGVQYLIEAATHLKMKNIDFQITIVGDGELRKELQEYVEKSGIGNFVKFLGAKPNHELPYIYAKHDLFVGPSIRTSTGDTEGLGLTFVEAGMSGCVLIGTDVGGISDVIRDGKTGYLIPEKNSAAIAERITHVSQNRIAMQKLEEKCRKECVEKFDWQVISRQYSRLLMTIVNQRPS